MMHQLKTGSMKVKKSRISELLAPFVGPALLSVSQLEAIQAYLDLLLRWNAKLNLTAIRDPEEVVTRHFGECLFAAKQLFPAGDSRVTAIDIGSGAGFPGLPLKLWSPSLNLTLIESNQRKATFLREVARTLHLNSVSVLAERAESVSLNADLVTFRAVERFERILPIAFSLVRSQGRIAILVGSEQVGLAQSTLSGMVWKTPVPIPLSKSRTLLFGNRRNSSTPT
jgi:16S rRNA (guanine527-N7)-methyltransferase